MYWVGKIASIVVSIVYSRYTDTTGFINVNFIKECFPKSNLYRGFAFLPGESSF